MPIRDLYIHRLRQFLNRGPNEAFRRQLFRYFDGELPHSRDFLTSLLQTIMDGPAANNQPRGNNSRTSIPRASTPWPVRIKKALLASLDHGTFEDIHVMVPSDPELTEKPLYFAELVDEMVGPLISRRKLPNCLQSEPVVNGASRSLSAAAHPSGRSNFSYNVGDELLRMLLGS